MKQKFVIYPAPDGFRFRYKAANGEKMFSGEAYTRRADAERAVLTIKEDVASAEIEHADVDPEGEQA